MELIDPYRRKIRYLRLSVTQACNLRCAYCMPEAKAQISPPQGVQMTSAQIDRIVHAFADLGVEKLRITGGEPLVRSDILSIIENAVLTDGIQSVHITTNGVLLKKYAKDLKKVGLNGMNISLDTLNPERYRKLTRGGNLDTVLNGIYLALEQGFDRIKINAVLMGGPDGIDKKETDALIDLTRYLPLSIRFIELMPLGECANWPKESFVSAQTLLSVYPEIEFVSTDGVASLYRMPGHLGTIGMITPMSHKFCSDCNRVRVSADGFVKPCLHSNDEIFILDKQGEELKETILQAVKLKPEKHTLSMNHKSETTRRMNQIGG